ncbi:MAG: YdcF family protein [Actinomycetota bacterium]
MVDCDEAEREEAAVERPPRRRLVTRGRIALAVAGLLAAYYLFNLADVVLGSTADYEGSAPAAVVMGAAQYNGSPSAALQGRLDRAAELYLDGRVDLVVVTGGGQEADITTEAKTGYDYLRQTAGMPDEDLRLEVDGASTYQSLAAVARFLAAEDIDEIILVTDPYHARRSQLIAGEVGLDAELVSTDAGLGVTRLVRESVATSVGRILGFRRVDAYLDV